MADNGNNVLDGLYLLAKSLPNIKAKAKEYITEIIGQISSTAIATWDSITGKPSVFPPDTHTHVEADITDLGTYIEEAPIDGTIYARQNAAWVAASSAAYTNEEAQDAVGGILTDTATIDFIYTDATPTIEANVKNSSITEAMQLIADNTTNDVTISAHGYVPKAPNNTTQFLRGDATWSTIPNTSWTTIIKSADEIRNTDGAVMADDGELLISLDASSIYTIRFFGSGATSAAADYKFNIAYTGTYSSIYILRQHTVANSTTLTSTVNTAVGFNQAVTGTAAGAFLIKMDIRISTTNAGTLSFQWAQNTSNASNTVIYAGSMIEYKKG